MHPVHKIRNLAIVAHIDHGKTTLIDSIFDAARLFRDNQDVVERVMDSNDLERERGITIRAKHCTVQWQEHLINIIDTPGHADFSGEVERIMRMVDSVLLLVDANEGPMPQTRYVLMLALKMGIKPIVLLNKVDRPNADPKLALNQTFDLFIELGATDEQADFPILYGSGLAGWVTHSPDQRNSNSGMTALFETIVDHVPAPEVNPRGPFRMQVSTLGWSDYLGHIGCGRVEQGDLKKGDMMRRICTQWEGRVSSKGNWKKTHESNEPALHMWVTRGLTRSDVDRVQAGDIVWIAGPDEISIGDTFVEPDSNLDPLPPLRIEEPTVSMMFFVNNGPFAGREGSVIMSRQITDRLERETRTNVALKIEDVGRSDGVKVSGRGELHLAILIEEMRREGLEFCVSRPEVITHRDQDGRLVEPLEELAVDVPEEFQGIVIEKLASRKGELVDMANHGTGLVRMKFNIPTRGLIGYRSDFLTDTRGRGTMNSRVIGYTPWKGEIKSRNRGSLVSMNTGQATSYQLESLQERATLFVEPTEDVYEGQVVGENSRPGDLPCNPTKRKVATNHRAASKDQTVALDVARKMTLDQALEWIAADELVEVTPVSIRIRKIILDEGQRRKDKRKRKQDATSKE
jgi:GTP-binding protein